MDINNHSTNEHVFGQRAGPAMKIDLLKNSERTSNKHKAKSKSEKKQDHSFNKESDFQPS
jgi:hypothetical protein